MRRFKQLLDGRRPGLEYASFLAGQHVGLAAESIDFTTGATDTTWPLIINTDGPTKQFLLDDVAIVDASVKGPWYFAPTITASAGLNRVALTLSSGAYAANSYDVSETLSGSLTIGAQTARAGGQLALRLECGGGQTVDAGQVSLPEQPANTLLTLAFTIPASMLPTGKSTLSAYPAGASAPIASSPVDQIDLPQLISLRTGEIDSELKTAEDRAARKGVSDNAYVHSG